MSLLQYSKNVTVLRSASKVLIVTLIMHDLNPGSLISTSEPLPDTQAHSEPLTHARYQNLRRTERD